MGNNGVLKGMLIALAAVYVLSPLDLAPGVVDDLLVVLLSYAANKSRSSSNALASGADGRYPAALMQYKNN